MPLNSSTNLYPGINLHLNSYLQSEQGGWESFHSDHITYLHEVLDRILPPGYFTRSEKSLQISEMVILLIETFEAELTGLVIYRVAGNGAMQPVTRLELLSPANKPGGSHHSLYMQKRLETLSSGLNLVEIDYLHETPPGTARLKDYSSGVSGAYPYTILVNNPHPTLEDGETKVYGWHIVDGLPVVEIPLAADDTIALDFGEVYRLTFERTRFYAMIVDYAQNPPHFERYSPDDQEKALAQLEHIRAEFGQQS